MDFFRKNILSITVMGLMVLGSISNFAFAKDIIPCGPASLGFSEECNACQLYQLIQNVIDFITLQIAPVLAVVMILVGAFFLITAGGSEESVKKGRDIITKTIIGILIIMGSWLVIDTVLLGLAKDYSSSGTKPWNKIKCDIIPQEAKPSRVAPSGTPTTPTKPTAPTSGLSWYEKHPELKSKDTSGSNWTLTEKAQLYTHNEALQKLEAQGIDVYGSGGLCANHTSSGCTSLNGIPKEAIDTLIESKKSCNCNITVTGGTEGGHQSQGFGKASIDLSYSDSLYSSLKKQSGVYVVREKQFNKDGTCDASWTCYSHVTGTHMSFYDSGADLYK